MIKESDKIELLIIDDDHLVPSIIERSIDKNEFNIHYADDGLKGLEMAKLSPPDIILLDIEMPKLDGYETCIKLRQVEQLAHTPILFLSSHSSLNEIIKGYDSGGDDFLAKPFEPELLLTRIKKLLKYQQQNDNYKELYEIAQATATTALTGLGELGLAMQFLEKSIAYTNIEELVSGLFQNTAQFNLDCCIQVHMNDTAEWHAFVGVVSPIEKDLVEMSDKNTRFLDFGEKTLVNYPNVSLLVKNMPIDDQEKYGRIKDILPVLVAATNVKVTTFEVQHSLLAQNEEMLETFRNIRRYLFHMGTGIVKSRSEGEDIANELIQALHADLLSMGLEQDQEDYLLDQIDTVSREVIEKMNSGAEIRGVLDYILTNLKNLINKQELILENFSNKVVDQSEGIEEDASVELF